MRNRNHGFDVTVIWNDENDEIRDIRVVGDISRYIPATGPSMENAGGDPAEGGEIEDYKIFGMDGIEIEDTDGKILEAVYDDVMEQSSEDAAGDACDAADARRDAREDR